MENRKTVIKWAVVLTVVALAVFAYATFGTSGSAVADVSGVAEAPSTPNTEDVSEAPKSDGAEASEETQDSVVYSEFPRGATTTEGYSFHHTGGTDDEQTRAAYVLGKNKYIVLQTESNGYDYRAKKSSVGLARICGDELVGTSTLCEGEYLDSRVTGAGIYVLLAANGGVRLILTDFSGEEVFRSNTVGGVSDGKLLSDGLGVRVYLLGAQKITLIKVDTEGMFTELSAFSHGIAEGAARLFGVLENAASDLLFLTFGDSTKVLEYSPDKGFSVIVSMLDGAVLQIVPYATESGTTYFLLLEKGAETTLARFSSVFAVEESRVLGEGEFYVLRETSGLLVSSDGILTYYCVHLDGGLSFSTGSGTVCDFLETDNCRYLVTESDNMVRVLCEKNFLFQTVAEFSGAGQARLYLDSSEDGGLVLFFDTESRTLESFGGKDCVCAAIPLTN